MPKLIFSECDHEHHDHHGHSNTTTSTSSSSSTTTTTTTTTTTPSSINKTESTNKDVNKSTDFSPGKRIRI